MRAATVRAAARPGAGRSGLAVVCGARVPRSSRPPPLRAAPTSPAEAPHASAPQAVAPPAVPRSLAATPFPLPAALQGTLIQTERSPRVQKDNSAANKGRDEKQPAFPTGAGPPGAAQQGVTKRRDRRRRQLDKKRADVAAAAAAVALGAAVQLADKEPELEPERKGDGQRRRRRRTRRGEQPGEAAATEENSLAAAAAVQRAPERQIPISPKSEDLLRWYDAVTAAAEQAHKPAVLGSFPQGRRRAAPAAIGEAATFVGSLQAPLQGWLNERVQDLGFESRQFPPLQTLPAALRQQRLAEQEAERAQQEGAAERAQQAQQATAEQQQQQQQQAQQVTSAAGGKAGDAHAEPPSSGSSSGSSSGTPVPSRRGCTTATFARWSAAAAGQLPLLASQWHRANASWELSLGAPLLHETHAAHEWAGEAEEHARGMIEMYADFARDTAGLPAVAGRLPASATMPGAAASYTVQAAVGGGYALEVACTHNLAHNYTRALLGSSSASSAGAAAEPQEQGAEAALFAQMGGGLQATVLGGMALVHGDDAGLLLPPALAPVQVNIVPLLHYRCDRGAMAAEAERLRDVLAAAGVRVAVDWRRRGPAGVRFGDSERRGIPLRIELGPRDLRDRTCVMAPRRSQAGRGGKLQGVSTDADALVHTVQALLEGMQADMRWDAAAAVEECIVDVASFFELRDVIESGKWARGPWAGSPDDEDAVFDETGATLLCIPLAQPVSMWGGYSTCLYSGYQASEVALFGRTL